MRVDDQALPDVDPHPIGPNAPIAWWPAIPTIAVERVPTGAETWDDPSPSVRWDAPGLVWDDTAAGGGYVDVVCDWHTLVIDPGAPDDQGLFPPVSCEVTVDNRDGRYSIFSADGRLVYFAPGRRLAVWATLAGEPWWLFNGRIAAWDMNPDATVTIVAYDGLADLAQEMPGEWTPGAAGDLPAERIAAIAVQAGYIDPLGGDVGANTLDTMPVTDDPLVAMQRAALSDGGVIAGDADGTVVYRDRNWRAGRSDQTAVPLFTDNVCNSPALVVWSPATTSNDEGLVNAVQLVNLAGLTAAAELPAGSPGQWWYGRGQRRLVHAEPDLWHTQGEGDELAAWLLANQSTASLRLAGFELQLTALDPTGWLTALDLRRGDRIEWLSDFVDPAGNPGRLDIFAVVVGVGHEATPEQWVTTVATTRATDFVEVYRWDTTPFRWDDPNPANVWRA